MSELARYVDLEPLVGRLKRAVVDVYMRDEGWKISDSSYYVEERDWVGRNVPVFRHAPRLCARPDEWGFRGGEIYDSVADMPQDSREGLPVRVVSYVGKFAEIRGRIDQIVDPWLDLPDPVLIGEAATAYGVVGNSLCRGTNEGLTGEGTLGPNMTRIWDELIGHAEEGSYYGPALSGTAVEAFKEYVRNLDRAIGGCGGIATALEKYVNAQRELWAAVRSNVLAVVSSIAGTCEAIAEQKSSDSGLSLEDVELGLGAASAAPGPVGLVATGAGAVVTIIKSAKSSNVQQAVEIESAEGAMDTLDKLLNRSFNDFGVNEMVETFERQTCVRITQNIQEVDAQRGMFDLAPGTIDTVDGVIRHDAGKVDNIVRRLDSVSVELGNVAYRLSGCVGEMEPPTCTKYGSGILARDSRVGISRNGPTDPLISLTDLLRAILTELSGEVMAGKGNFKAAMDVLDRANSENWSALAAAAQAYGLSDQGGIDSFDFHPWTPAGRAEAAERAARQALGLFGGSPSGTERASGPTGTGVDAPQPAPAPVIDWRRMQEGWANGVGPSTGQP